MNDSEKAEIIEDNNILMKLTGKECLTAYIKNCNYTVCFDIYNTPKINFEENSPIKIETYCTKNLKLNKGDYPESNIKYKSNYPDIIKVDNKGEITAIRPGKAIITASGLDNTTAQIKIISISNNGFVNNYTLNNLNITQCENIMIVAHPDDEILWGGANLFKDNYFVVCLTNGYNLKRANDFKKILEFTKNKGIILNYPDVQDFIKDDWTLVRKGMLKDLEIILNYKNWNKIVTHGPDGTGGHYHHIKTFQFVTEITKKLDKYNNLYYFATYYNNPEISKNIPRITDNELKIKMKEVSLYKSVKKVIYGWAHMLPFESFLLASKWKNIYINNL